jgi:hypothetical protein
VSVSEEGNRIVLTNIIGNVYLKGCCHCMQKVKKNCGES